MKRQSPFPSMATLIAEMRVRDAAVNRCCGALGDHDVPDAILASKRWPAASAPRKGGSPPPVERPRLWEEHARKARAVGTPRKDGAPQEWTPVPEEGDCACKEPKPRKRPPREPTTEATHVVDGAWLASVLRWGEARQQELAGQPIHLNEEAWQAVTAPLLARAEAGQARGLTRRLRAETWPEEAEQEAPPSAELNLQPGDGAPCGCTKTLAVTDGPRYVDSELGDDDFPGTLELEDYGVIVVGVLLPWRTLRRVERWLNDEIYEGMDRQQTCVEGAEVYLRAGRTWDGSEEHTPEEVDGAIDWAAGPDDDPHWTDVSTDPVKAGKAVLVVRGFKGSNSSPLCISAYALDSESLIWADTEGVEYGARAVSGGTPEYPLLDGVVGAPEGAKYDRDVLGIQFLDCCYVVMSYLRLRGFAVAINTRGGSKHHWYMKLLLEQNAGGGVSFGVKSTDVDPALTVADGIAEIYASQRYPEYINLIECMVRDTGYNTADADIGIGFMATNCMVLKCSLRGTNVRGVDGIVSQGGSSGHLIAENFIALHYKLCYSTKDGSAQFVPSRTSVTLCKGEDWVLEVPCTSSTGAGCEDTDYGYQIYRGGPSTSGDQVDGFGEDGIDLKGVRADRTPTSAPTTVIRGNRILGQRNFTGIALNDGTRGVHVYQNRIYGNAHGVVVTNSENDGWYNDPNYYQIPTGEVYIYRNLIYMNHKNGIRVATALSATPADSDAKGADVRYEVEDVYIINNTIAHNLWAGVQVLEEGNDTDGASGESMDRVFIYNNLFLHNGRDAGVRDDGKPDDLWYKVQLLWGDTLSMSRERAWSDYNGYIGWDLSLMDGWKRSDEDPAVDTNGNEADGVLWHGVAVSVATASETWVDGVEGLEEHGLQLTGPLALWTAGFANYAEFIELSQANGALLADTIKGTSAVAVGAMNYSLAGWLFPAVANKGLSDERILPGGADLGAALSQDFEARSVYGEIDLGAYEVSVSAKSRGRRGVHAKAAFSSARSLER